MKIVTFSNLGNTCYINSVLQCFIYNSFFQKHVLHELHTCINLIDLSKNDERVCVVYNLTSFLSFLFTKKKQFKQFQQNDAHEFLIEFLDILTQTFHGPVEKHKNKNYHDNSYHYT